MTQVTQESILYIVKDDLLIYRPASEEEMEQVRRICDAEPRLPARILIVRPGTDIKDLRHA